MLSQELRLRVDLQELVIEQDYHLILTSNWGSTDSKDSLAMSVTTSTKLG